jgi:hypothetical protein
VDEKDEVPISKIVELIVKAMDFKGEVKVNYLYYFSSILPNLMANLKKQHQTKNFDLFTKILNSLL